MENPTAMSSARAWAMICLEKTRFEPDVVRESRDHGLVVDQGYPRKRAAVPRIAEELHDPLSVGRTSAVAEREQPSSHAEALSHPLPDPSQFVFALIQGVGPQFAAFGDLRQCGRCEVGDQHARVAFLRLDERIQEARRFGAHLAIHVEGSDPRSTGSRDIRPIRQVGDSHSGVDEQQISLRNEDRPGSRRSSRTGRRRSPRRPVPRRAVLTSARTPSSEHVMQTSSRTGRLLL